MTRLLKSQVKSNVLKLPSVCLEIESFSTHLLGGNCAPVPTPFSPDKAISAFPVKISLNKGKR